MTLAEFDDRARRAYRSFNTFEQLLSDLNACDHGMYWARGKSLGDAWRGCNNPSFMSWWISKRMQLQFKQDNATRPDNSALAHAAWRDAHTELEALTRGARLTVAEPNSPTADILVCRVLRRVYHWSGRKK